MAYRFAKGAPVVHLGRPSSSAGNTPDFLVVSDHAELMGVIRSVYYNGVNAKIFSHGAHKAWIAAVVLRDAADTNTAEVCFGCAAEPEDDIARAAADRTRTWVGYPYAGG